MIPGLFNQPPVHSENGMKGGGLWEATATAENGPEKG